MDFFILNIMQVSGKTQLQVTDSDLDTVLQSFILLNDKGAFKYYISMFGGWGV